MVKGSMTLIDTERAESLYAAMGPAVEISGGSAANTMAGLASFGQPGRVHRPGLHDQLGEVFTHDLRAAGVHVRHTAGRATGSPSGRCLIVVTPDAERTMSTYLGASVGARRGRRRCRADRRGRGHVPRGLPLGRARRPGGLPLRRRPTPTRPAGASRSPCRTRFSVDRHRDTFLDLVDGRVDILFANEAEITALYEVDDFDVALPARHRPLRGRRADPQREGLGDRAR